MGSSFPHDDDEYLSYSSLPSTFSPWQYHEQSGIELAQRNVSGPETNGDNSDSPISAWTMMSSFDGTHHAPSIVSQDQNQQQQQQPYQHQHYYPGDIVSPVSRAEDSGEPRQAGLNFLDTPTTVANDQDSDISLQRSPELHRGPSMMGNVNAMRSTEIMPTHPAADSMPMTAVYSPPTEPASSGEEDVDTFSLRYSKPPLDCYSRRDVHVPRLTWLYSTLLAMSTYSTVLSAVWLTASIVQPSFGQKISTSHGKIMPSTATLVATLLAKTIELSFVTVFVAVLGQVLTRRAFSRTSKGVTLVEMTMRNWVVQPGSLITHWQGLPYAATTFLGALTLTATLCALLYTTASDAMVSPKLGDLGWRMRTLQGRVKASYGNTFYVGNTCATPLRKVDSVQAGISCEDVVFSGQSYHSLIAFLAQWENINNGGDLSMTSLPNRPVGTASLNDNTTLISSWIETEYANVTANNESHDRIINNVTLAIPHPGVYSTATDPINGILQPEDLSGVGRYSVQAAVVSPAINVMCVNMNQTELEPLVYPSWPGANTTTTDQPGQRTGFPDWLDHVPQEWYVNSTGYNKTVVDDIFLWGEAYSRSPPIFPLYPADNNMVTYTSGGYPDYSLYVLGKRPNITDYTLCEMRSWVTAKCSTRFDISGTQGSSMEAHCEDPADLNSYERVYPANATEADKPSPDWRQFANEWGLSINLNGGTQNNNASNARILTNLILDSPELDPALPSMAEAMAVLATSTLVAGSIDTTFQPVWTYADALHNILDDPGVYEQFHAEVQTQQYRATHTEAWQAIFYPILGLVFILNVLCLTYILFGASIASLASKSSPSHKYSSNNNKNNKGSPRKFSLGTILPYSFYRTHTSVNNKNSPSLQEEDSDSSSEDIDDDINPDDVNQNNNGLATSTSSGGLRRRGGGAGGGKGGGARSKALNGLVTDYTETQNLFALAINSPPSDALAGSCGHGPDKAELLVPFRVGYAPGANHYFFKEGGASPNTKTSTATAAKSKHARPAMMANSRSSGVELLGVRGANLNRQQTEGAAAANNTIPEDAATALDPAAGAAGGVGGGGQGGLRAYKNNANNKSYKRLSSNHAWL